MLGLDVSSKSISSSLFHQFINVRTPFGDLLFNLTSSQETDIKSSEFINFLE